MGLAVRHAFPRSIGEALALLAGQPGAMLRASGTRLQPMIDAGRATPTVLVDLRRVPDLARIDITPDATRIGAKVRLVDLARHSGLVAAQPTLVAAAEAAGTIGGCLAHADPASALIAAAIAGEGVVTLVAPTGTRNVMVADFIIGPHQTVRRADEMIVGLRLSAPDRVGQLIRGAAPPA